MINVKGSVGKIRAREEKGKLKALNEVLPFGSVPLRTYLPHGDIDLTTFTQNYTEKFLAGGLYKILKKKSPECADFIAQDVEVVHAQVKVVKCVAQNISIDISFNQVAGLSSLCFLEKVAEHIGRDHLFKRSIILVKAWCFYESRILGAQYGLISTYALEIMVLYIINFFHSPMDCPLAVLYKFLEYYSTFDWENYCISVYGPVPVECSPKTVGAMPETSSNSLLLAEGFLDSCIKNFSVWPRANETADEAAKEVFQMKHLNIIDPLKDTNNLGRSVSRGKFMRIISALSFGYGRLREVLMVQREDVGPELKNFFVNTLKMNGRASGLDESSQRFELCSLDTDYEQQFMNLITGHWYCRSTPSIVIEPSWQMASFLSWLENFVPLNNLFSGSSSAIVPTISKTNMLQLFKYFIDVDGREKFTETNTYKYAAKVVGELAVQEAPADRVHATVGRISNSPGTGAFIPNCVIENKTYQAKYTRTHDQSSQEKFKWHASRTYGRDRDVERKPALQGSRNQYLKFRGKKNYNTELSIGDKASFRLKASTRRYTTCLTDAHDAIPGMSVPGGAQRMEPKHRGVSLRSTPGAEQEGVGNSCFDLSLEDFPRLPSRKKSVLSENDQSIKPSIHLQPAFTPLCSMKAETASSMRLPAPSVSSLPLAMKASKDYIPAPIFFTKRKGCSE